MRAHKRDKPQNREKELPRHCILLCESSEYSIFCSALPHYEILLGPSTILCPMLLHSETFYELGMLSARSMSQTQQGAASKESIYDVAFVF